VGFVANSYTSQQCKNFENRLRFDKVTDSLKVGTFWRHGVHPFNVLFSRTTWVSEHQRGKPFWILLEQEMMGGGSGISGTICKSFAPRSRQITTPLLTTQFLQAGCPSCHQTNSVKALKGMEMHW